MKKEEIYNLQEKAKWLRIELFKMLIKSKSGHIPSCFSMVEILVSLYYGGISNLNHVKYNDEKRDRVLISKGHAAMALYPILADLGNFEKNELEKFTEVGGILGLYADFRIPGIEGISGSLGHGVGMGAGFAYDAKINNEEFKTFVILGDGECYEGSIWESAIFAASKQLENLVVFVDRNNLCILGKTEELLKLGDLKQKWASFGWESYEIDGHDFNQIFNTITEIKVSKSCKPKVVICNTIKGKGVSFMEGKAEWHNRVPSKELLELGIEELKN
jgi:transketolase